MTKLTKRIAVLILVVSLIGTSVTPVSAEEAKPYEGVTLNVLSIASGFIETIRPRFPEFEEATGCKIEFQLLSNEQASNKIAVSMTAGGADLDVFSTRPLDEKLLYSQNGWYEYLDDYVARDAEEIDYDDFMPACIDVCTDREGNLTALPYMTEAGLMYYNKTLFENAGITEDEIPKTWDELYELAGRLNDPDNNICGFVCRGAGNPSVTQFSAVLRSFGGDFFDEDGNAALNTPEAVAAFEFYGKLLRDYGPAGVTNMGWAETWNLFTQGFAAMRLDANTNLGSWKDEDSVISLDEVGYFNVPVGPNGDYGDYSITSWALAMSSGSPNKELAWEFIKWATSKEMQIEAQKIGNSGACSSCWAENYSSYPENVQEYAAYAGEHGYGSDRPSMINVARGRDIIGEIVVAAIEGNQDIQALADEKNAEFQELLDSEK